MQLNDLWVQCDRCKGEGQISEGTPSTGFGTQQVGYYGSCPNCNGRGGTITEQGKVLADFFRIVKNKGPF